MSLVEKINNDIKAAMLAKEKDKLDALRAAKSAFLLAKTEKGATAELDDTRAIQILQKLIKQRKESAEIYKTQARDDLFQKEISEVKVLEVYLPEQMDEAKLTQILKRIISDTGASSVSDTGKVMGIAAKQLAGKADNKIIAQKVRELLS